MKTVILIFLALAAGLLKRGYNSIETMSPGSEFITCTECPKDIRGFLNIPANADCDMVKWKLFVFDNGKYKLDAEWKYIVDNRTEAKGGELLNSQGTWKVSKTNPGYSKSEVYIFAADDRPSEWVSMLKLNDNMFQLMTKEKKLAIGGGGWSNTLNRVNPVVDESIDFTLSNSVNTLATDSLVLQGRSPFTEGLGLDPAPGRIKIKWLLSLKKDQTFKLRRVMARANAITGKWSVVKGWKDNKDAVVYKLDTQNPQPHSLYLLKGSEDVFFFVSQEKGMLVGNDEFSYTLNRRY